MQIHLSRLAQAGLLASLVACGGGDGNNATPEPPTNPENILPVVSAGNNQQVNSGEVVTLSGTATDADGFITRVLWEQTFGTPLVLNGSDTLTATFTTESINNPPVTLGFRLTAFDNDNGQQSSTVTVTLLAPVSGTSPVIADIASQRVNESETVTLDASATDQDGEVIAYTWVYTGSEPALALPDTDGDGSPDDLDIANNGDNIAAATFEAPDVDVVTTMSFELTVADNADPANETTATTSVTVYPLPQAAKASSIYVSDGAAKISRFVSSALAPTEFTSDNAFGDFDPGAGARTIDGPFALGVDGRMVQTDDEDANSIQEVCSLPRRLNNDQFDASRDRTFRYYVDVDPADENQNEDAYIENYAGVAIAHAAGFVIAIDTFAGQGSGDARAIHVYGGAVSGAGRLVADIPLAYNGRDLLLDEEGDRLFVSLDNGRIAVFNDFIAEIEAARGAVSDSEVVGGSITSDSLIAIEGFENSSEHDFTGLAYHRDSDRLIVADMGVMSSASTPDGISDGKIIILSNTTDAARSGFGAVVAPDAVIVGSGGDHPIGDPMDIALNGRDLIVADHATNRVSVYADIFGVVGESAPAPADGKLVVAGASYLVVQPLDVPARPHLNDLSPDAAVVDQLVVLREGDDAGQATVEAFRIPADLSTIGADPIKSLSYHLSRDAVSGLGVGINGDLYIATTTANIPDSIPLLVTGSDGVTGVQVVSRAATRRMSLSGTAPSGLYDRSFNLGGELEEATSTLVIDEFGVMIVSGQGGRSNAAGLSIFSMCGTGGQLGGKILTADNTGAEVVPTDVDYDGARGDLYLSFADGSFGIFRAFDRYLESLVANPETPNTPNPLLVVRPQVVDGTGNRVSAAADYQAIEYLSGLDQLALVVQGSENDNADGELHIIGRQAGFAASELFGGNVDVNIIIRGNNTALGNPVDLAFDGSHLYVAENGNGAVLRFDDIATIAVGGNIEPSSSYGLNSTVMDGIEAIVPLPDYVAASPAERLP